MEIHRYFLRQKCRPINHPGFSDAEGKYYVYQLKKYVINELLPEILDQALRIENKQNEVTEPGDSGSIDSRLAVASPGFVARRGKAGTHGELQGRVHD